MKCILSTIIIYTIQTEKASQKYLINPNLLYI